jgi:CheY-like chemotaxis protein
MSSIASVQAIPLLSARHATARLAVAATFWNLMRAEVSSLTMAKTVTVLFVDDDDDVRAPLAAQVRGDGFRVLEACNTPEALRTLAQEHVDVLFTDVVMPEPDGIELAERAKHLQPHIRVIFATGYLLRAATAEKMGKLLFKPVRAKDILGALSELMRQSPSDA